MQGKLNLQKLIPRTIFVGGTSFGKTSHSNCSLSVFIAFSEETTTITLKINNFHVQVIPHNRLQYFILSYKL